MNEIRSSGVGRRGLALLSVAMPTGRLNLSALCAGALVFWFSWPTLLSLHTSFVESADYSHGYLLFALTAVLVAREIRRKPLAPASGSAAGTAVLLLLVVAVIVGHASTTVVLAQLALPLLWLSAIWAFSGARNALRIGLPFSYLFLAIPVWNLLVEPLRRLTIYVVTSWTRAAGLPAFIEGNFIHVPTGTFEVQGGCAGLRYVLVALALALFTCLIQRRRLGATVLFTSVALVLALVGNWLRVFITVAAGLAPEGEIAMLIHNQHTLVGWVIFAVFMVPLFYLDQKLPPPRVPVSAESTVERPTNAPSSGATIYVACAALALAIWLNYRISEDEIVGPVRTLTIPAPEIAEWNRSADWQDARRPVFIEPSGEAASWYAKGDLRIGAYVAHYTAQRQGREVVFAHNLPAGTGFVSSRHRVTNAALGPALSFQELNVADAQDQQRLVWVGFRIAGEPAANAFEAKALQVAGVLRGRRDAQAVVLTAACDDDCEKARGALSDFAVAAAEPLYAQVAQFGIETK